MSASKNKSVFDRLKILPGKRFKQTGAAGLEPATGGLEVRYSIQLSYAPKSMAAKDDRDLQQVPSG